MKNVVNLRHIVGVESSLSRLHTRCGGKGLKIETRMNELFDD
jgi:hypothetical protein